MWRNEAPDEPGQLPSGATAARRESTVGSAVRRPGSAAAVYGWIGPGRSSCVLPRWLVPPVDGQVSRPLRTPALPDDWWRRERFVTASATVVSHTGVHILHVVLPGRLDL